MNEYQRYGEYNERNMGSISGPDTAAAMRFLLIGMGIGAAIALLITPVSGSELRSAIGQGCRNAFDGISEQTRNLRDRGSNLLGFSRRKAASGVQE
jgi:gas vesicle protein